MPYGTKIMSMGSYMNTMTKKLNILGGDDVSLSGNGYLQLGPTNDFNIVADINELQARYNGASSILYLQPDGGNVHVNNNLAYHAGNLLSYFDMSSPLVTVNGGMFMFASQSVTPTKKLSQCKNGWILVWSDYDVTPAPAKPNDFNWAFSVVPKGHPSISGGGNAFFQIPRYQDTTSQSYTIKSLTITDTTISGDDLNDDGGNFGNDVALRYVFEF